MKKTILIDLDGVLNQYNGKFEKDFIPKPAENADKFLKNLCVKFDIFIFTSREYNLAKNWLKLNSLDKYVKDVTNIKLPCYLHIDDRAICYNGNFEDTIKRIKTFKPHWK